MCKGDLEGGYDYNFDIWKFCRKSFCQFDALKNYKGKVLWLDADTVTTKRVSEKFIDEIFDGAGLAFLGRDGFYTETGFIGFDTQSDGFSDFLQKYEDCYRKGKIFTLKRWHDCEAFDWARSFKHVSENNLSKDWKLGSRLDVFERSILGKAMVHNKGQRKFQSKIYRD
jgi:hypothetical protein